MTRPRERQPLGRRINRSLKAGLLPLATRWLASADSRRSSPRLPGSALFPQPPIERILVVRQDNRLGNLLLLGPFLKSLREARPKATIGAVIGEVYAPLLRQWPWVDQWIVQEKRRQARAPWEFPRWIADLRRGEWDLAFEASNHNTHSFSNCLLTLASGADLRVGFEEPRNQDCLNLAVPSPERELPFSLAPLRLLRALGWSAEASLLSCPFSAPASPEFLDWSASEGLCPSLENDGTKREAPAYVLVHLGGRGGKAWPIAAWVSFLDRAADSISDRIVLVAGPGERERMSRPQRQDRILTAPPLGLQDLIYLIRGARVYLGCDTGVMHLAAALGTPTISLFFRSNPYHYAPLGRQHRLVLLANPYSVEPEVWDRPVEGLERARLEMVATDPARSAAGVPASDPGAVQAVVAALRSALR